MFRRARNTRGKTMSWREYHAMRARCAGIAGDSAGFGDSMVKEASDRPRRDGRDPAMLETTAARKILVFVSTTKPARSSVKRMGATRRGMTRPPQSPPCCHCHDGSELSQRGPAQPRRSMPRCTAAGDRAG